MSDIERQLEDFLKEKQLNFNDISEEKKQKIGEKYFDKFVLISKKIMVIGQLFAFLKSKIAYLSEEKKAVYKYLDKFIIYKETEISKKMSKVESSSIDIEEMNILLYDIGVFLDRTFAFVNSYFFDNTLVDGWKF